LAQGYAAFRCRSRKRVAWVDATGARSYDAAMAEGPICVMVELLCVGCGCNLRMAHGAGKVFVGQLAAANDDPCEAEAGT
jgi:hypothetical protein